jgi:hypothetical protein
VLQALALEVVVVWPAGQAVHTRFEDAAPAWLTYWPAEQLVHVVQEVALVVALNAPGAHGEHVWSVVVDPSTAIC